MTHSSGYTTSYHVHSMTTGQPHPHAANQGRIDIPDGLAVSSGGSGFCGDYIGATAYNPLDRSTHLILWNWKTGLVKVDAVSRNPQLFLLVSLTFIFNILYQPLPTPPLGIRPTFSYLDRHHILAGFLWTGELQPKELLVCALDQRALSDDGLISAVPTFIFTIPRKLKRRDFWEIHTHRNSIPLRPEYDPLEGYFDNDPNDQLVAIEMASRHYTASEVLDAAISVYIPTRAMLRCIPTSALPRTASTFYTTISATFSWDNWGEGRALILKRVDKDIRLPMLSRVCGLRQVARKPATREDGKSVFRVMDFHPRRALRTVRASNPCGTLGRRGARPVHAVIEVPLPEEVQTIDPALIATSICQDALIIFEVRFLFFPIVCVCLYLALAHTRRLL
jgi:hypothetical protein